MTLAIVKPGKPSIILAQGSSLIGALTLQAQNAAAVSEFASVNADLSANVALAASLTAPNVYATTAAGLAAVSEGQTFWSNQSGSPVLYRDVAGVAVALDMLGNVRNFANAAALAAYPFSHPKTATIGGVVWTTSAVNESANPLALQSTSSPGSYWVPANNSASLIAKSGGGTVQDFIDDQEDGVTTGGVITSGGTFTSSTATVGPDASAQLQSILNAATANKIPTVELTTGDESYSLLSAPLVLQGGGTTIRGQRGMTYSRGIGKTGAFILGSAVQYGFHVGEGTSPIVPGASGADCYTFQDIGFMKDTGAALKSQAGIYFNLQSNGPPRGVNLYGVSGVGLRAGFEVAPPVALTTTILANLTVDGACFSNNRYGVYASGPLYGMRMVGSQVEQNNASSAPATALTGVALGSGGSGFTNGQRVWLTAADGTGRGAVATIAVAAGAITSFTITVGGHGYTVGEALNIVHGVGTGAAATVASVGAPDQWDGGAVHGNIQGPVSIMDNQIEGQPNPISLQAIGGPGVVQGSATIKARVGFNYLESIGVNSSKYAGRFGTTDRTHNNVLDFGPNFYAGSSLPPDFLILNQRGNWEINLRDPNALTLEQWNGSILRGSRLFTGPIDHFFVKGFSPDANGAPEVYLGDGFNRHDASGGNLTAAAVSAAGTGYVNGETVSLTGTDGRGIGATATIAVTAGAITGFTIVLAGIGYATGNALTVTGGTGTGGTGTGTAGAVTPWIHSAAFTSGEKVITGRGPLFVRDATLPTPLGFGVTAGDLVVVTAYVSVQNRNANIFRAQVTRNSGAFIASTGDSYADVISRGDWVHICYPFLAPSTVPDIAFKYATSGGANVVAARIAGLCARNYGAYTNDGVARQQIIPFAPRLL